MSTESLETLQRELEHTFRSQELLLRAVTHSSLAFEHAMDKAAEKPAADAALADNEQMEFLGDAVLGLLVAELLYTSFPELQEGDLTRLRATLVSRRHLGEVAQHLHLGHYLRLGRGEERSGGRKKAVLLANMYEALVGALYLDAGLEATRAFVLRTAVGPYLHDLHQKLCQGHAMGDHKSALQELLQARKAAPPAYTVKAETGPDHRKRFLVEVRVDTDEGAAAVRAEATGSTKKKAEQEAARLAYEEILQARPWETDTKTSDEDAAS
ncbi:MAG: ribonuclease III [Acidobacteriaceae bacterium]